jgi:histidyl-tRNA synthetase
VVKLKKVIMIQRIKGTQDFIDLSLFNFIVDQATKHLTTYHFSSIATPIVEPVELFKRSLGLETDIVSKEMFMIDAGSEHETICLRPEATASTVRAFVENGIQQVPWKVFSWGPMFRHERPQKGRYRQFHQFNVEIIGSAAIAQDAQFIAMLDRFFSHVLAFDSYALLINFLGCPEDRCAYRITLYDFLTTAQEKICDNCRVRKEANILRVLDCKNPHCQKLYEQAPQIIQHLCSACTTQWQELQQYLSLLSVSFSVKPTLVRGLDYYNKTVFEFVSGNLGAQNAFCSGGRYDQLLTRLGGKEDQPSIGAAMGIERLILILEPLRDRLLLPQLPVLHAILPLTTAQHSIALLLAQELAIKNLCVDLLLDYASLKSMMRHANKMGAKYCILIGEEEQAQKEVTIKNMITGQEECVKQIALVDYLKR